MPKETKREKIIRWLKERRGAVEVESPSSKYVCLKRNDSSGQPIYHFIGRSGGVRNNRSCKISGSWSVSDRIDILISKGVIQ